MKEPASGPFIALSIADPLKRRIVAEAVEGRGYKITLGEPCIVTVSDADDTSEDRKIIILQEDGRTRVRLGRLLTRLRMEASRALDGIVSFGPYRLDIAYATLQGGESDIVLTEKERDILVRLHRENGALDRRTLLGDVWGYAEAVETHTLETHIYRLRRKIEADPAAPVWLVTDGTGYRLNK